MSWWMPLVNKTILFLAVVCWIFLCSNFLICWLRWLKAGTVARKHYQSKQRLAREQKTTCSQQLVPFHMQPCFSQISIMTFSYIFAPALDRISIPLGIAKWLFNWVFIEVRWVLPEVKLKWLTKLNFCMSVSIVLKYKKRTITGILFTTLWIVMALTSLNSYVKVNPILQFF